MAAPTIQFKRGAYSGITSFRAGEPAFTTDTFDFFIGLDNTLGNNKFFGSHRYWTRETGSAALNLNLVDKDGTNKISLKSPDTLSGNTTYTLPETPVNTYLLTTNGSGVLSWTNAIPGGTLTGVTTFTDTTDNTLGNADTGAVQIDGGLGVNKNVTVGGNLNVQGYSEFVGVATFKGGTINLGDADTDDINVAGEFISNLVPNTDDTYDIGNGGASKRWRNASFSGVGTFASGAVADAIQIGITAAGEIDTSSGNLTIDSAGGTVTIDDQLSVSGVSTFTGAIDANGGATIDNIQIGITGDNEIDTSSGNLTIDSAGGTVTIDDELIVSGDVRINGNDIKASDGNTNITLTGNTLTTFAGDVKVGGNDIQASDGNTNITMTSNTLTEVKGDLKVTGNDIQDSGGNAALTFDGSQNVTANANLTVSGNLYVNGSTTQVNTSSMTVEDRTIELGLVDGSAPSSTTTWDLGVLFNYNSSGAKKSGVVWEQADTRFKFASQVSDGGGTDNNSPQITFTAYAPIEIGALWVNDCAGQSQVISCTGSERFLENITIDCGQF
jgi:hypothetical protein